MTEQKIRVLVADDQELVRSGYKAILGTFPYIDVVGMARNGREAVSEALRLKPDVVLMDIRMPELSGIDATRQITESPLLPGTHVLVLTTFDVDEYVYEALQAGASGFMLKDADPEEIASGIRIVANGDALIQPSVMRRVVETFANLGAGSKAASGSGEAEGALDVLSGREREILQLVARGKDNAAIAEELFISPATVKTHLARMMGKTGTHDRAQLVILAYESGLVTPSA
ncbi:MAG: response regulator transcription factor [Eggerthellaceae bacterium]|nr:response regulator transcription factor [Eggerthellaceae bacterium]